MTPEELKRRQTKQRKLILDYLKSVKTHPTAEVVYQKVKPKMPNITLATVYRNLNLLADEGEILKLEINKEYRYDADNSSHQHGICKKCGVIIDFFQHNISRYALKKLKHDNFKPKTVVIIFSGECKDCSKIDSEHKLKSRSTN